MVSLHKRARTDRQTDMNFVEGVFFDNFAWNVCIQNLRRFGPMYRQNLHFIVSHEISCWHLYIISFSNFWNCWNIVFRDCKYLPCVVNHFSESKFDYRILLEWGKPKQRAEIFYLLSFEISRYCLHYIFF